MSLRAGGTMQICWGCCRLPPLIVFNNRIRKATRPVTYADGSQEQVVTGLRQEKEPVLVVACTNM